MKQKWPLKLIVAGLFTLLLFISACRNKDVVSPTPALIKINQQPIDGTVCLHSQYNLSVTAECNAELHYQQEYWNNYAWINVHKDEPYYRTPPLSSSRSYRVLVYADDTLCLPVYSREAIVHLVPDVEITESPKNTMIGRDEPFELKVIAKGGGELHYEWEVLSGSNWIKTGIDSAVLVHPGLTENATFRVSVIASGCSKLTSATASVLVTPINLVTGDFTGYCHHVLQIVYPYGGGTTIQYDTVDHREFTIKLFKTVFEKYFILDVSSEVPNDLFIFPNNFSIPFDDLLKGKAEAFNWQGRYSATLKIDLQANLITIKRQTNLLPGLDRTICYCAIE